MFLRYLSDLSAEHQRIWQAHEVTSEPVPSDDAALKEYSAYLGVFFFLGVVLAALAIYQTIIGSSLFRFRWIAWTGSAATPLLSAACGFDKVPIIDHTSSLKTKKVALLVSFTIYVVTAAALTCWGGGARASTYSNLLLLTAALSTYVAKQPWTKFTVALLAGSAYVLTSVYYFDSATSTTVTAFDRSMLVDFGIIAVVLVISGVSSSKAQRAVAAS